MTPHEANLRAVSICASFLITFLGLAHEFVGPTLFPWAPEWFGPLAWHGIGIAAIVVGLLCLGGVLGVLDIPVVPIGIAMALGGLAAMALMAIKNREFHYFAMWLAIAGTTLAMAHSRTQRLRRI